MSNSASLAAPIPFFRLNQASLLVIFLTGLAIPTYTIFSHLFILIIFLFIILDRNHYANYWERLRPQRIVWVAILLFGLLTIGISYSSAPLN